MFADINNDQDLTNDDLNKILKNLYDSNFLKM